MPGVYLANVTPPIVGFGSFEEFILTKDESRSRRQEQKFQRILEEIESERIDENVPN